MREHVKENMENMEHKEQRSQDWRKERRARLKEQDVRDLMTTHAHKCFPTVPMHIIRC